MSVCVCVHVSTYTGNIMAGLTCYPEGTLPPCSWPLYRIKSLFKNPRRKCMSRGNYVGYMCGHTNF